MRFRTLYGSAATLAMALSLGGAALAEGVPVMPWFAEGQLRPALAADGAGGAWLAFKTDSLESGLAHLAPNGLADHAWPNGIYRTGLAVVLGSPPRLLANSPDRVVLVTDYCEYNRIAMGYDAFGDTATGFPASATLFYPSPLAVMGADGRVLAAQPAALGFSSYGVRYAIVSPLGALLSEGEVTMQYRVFGSEPFAVIPDGANGAIVGMSISITDDFSSGYDLGLLRIAADGTRPWGNAGVIMCAANGDQRTVRMWPDGTGGALVTWNDARTSPAASPLDIYAARFTSAGVLAAGWTSQGKRVAAATGGQFESRVVDDGAGGAWILWRDQRVADIDLYFTHVLGNGAFATGFTSAGTLLCGATGSASDPQMVPDGAGGFFAVWLDPRDGEADLYGTHITAAGTPAAGWPANGLALCDDPARQAHPAIVATGAGKAIVAWRDERIAAGHVYTLALDDGGPVTTGVPPAQAPALRLRAAVNPSFGLADLWLAAPAGGRVDVDLLDVTGRVVRRASVSSTGAESRVRFEAGPAAPGVYFATARQGAHRATVRLCVLR